MEEVWLVAIQCMYIVLWAYVYVYIVHLEKIGCECSKDWRRSYIKYYVMIMVPLLLLRVVGVVPKAIFALSFVFTIFFVIEVYRYIHHLKEVKCACSESPVRDVLEVVNIIQIGLLAFALAIFVGAVVLLFIGNRVAIPLKQPKTKALRK